MEKVINIGASEVKMATNAFTPIKFKSLFKEDLLTGLSKISEENLDIDILSKLAYCMALQADNSIGDMEKWLSQFELTEFYNALPDVMSLWADNTQQDSKPKKAQGK